MKNALHVVNVDNWIAQTPEWQIRLLVFLIAVGPVLTVTGWFYFAGNSTGQSQSHYQTLPADVPMKRAVISPQAYKDDPATAGLSIPTAM